MYKRQTPAVEQSQEALAAQAEAAAEMQSMWDEMGQTARQFAVSLRPLIEGFKWLMNLVQEVNSWFGGYLITAFVLVTGAIVSLVKITKMLNSIMALFNVNIIKTIALKIKAAMATLFQAKSNDTLKDSEEKKADAISKGGKAAGAAAIQMMAFGVAILLIGAGIAVAALGVAALAYSFSLMNAGQILASAVAIGVFMLGMVAVVAIMAALVAGPQAALTAGGIAVLLSIGFAVLLIGGAVFLAAAGLALLVYSFSSLFKVASAGELLAFSAAMGIFVAILYGLLLLGPSLPGLMAVMAGISLAMLGMSWAISKINFDNFEPLTNFFTALRDLAMDSETSLMGVANAIAKMTTEINKLDADKAIRYTAVLERATTVASNASATGATSSASGLLSHASAPQPVTIVLKIKEKQIKKVVGKIVDGQFAMENT